MSLKTLILNSENGYFGSYGGRYVAEMLVGVMDDLAQAFDDSKEDPLFWAELQDLYETFSGRPTPLLHCKNLSNHFGGAQIYLKNEGLNHTGAHKINHVIGQVLLAQRMGKTRIITETGAGQNGLATATVCAKMGLECVIYMGQKDYDRQRPNVFWMETLGAQVVPVPLGGQVLRDAINEAMRDLLAHPEDTHYLLGTACGPHPYPAMNATFQSVVGREVAQQLPVVPEAVVACVGGGSNGLGIFAEFLDNPEVRLIGVEAGGRGMTEDDTTCDHAARMHSGTVGINEGFKSYMLQNQEGQIKNTHSISAGLDYSGVSPQMAHLRDIGRVEFAYATDEEVLEAYSLLAQKEGILAAMESSHAFVEAFKMAPTMKPDQTIVVNCSGRGDKDLFIVAPALDEGNFKDFLKTQI